jgi:hypothetical protein
MLVDRDGWFKFGDIKGETESLIVAARTNRHKLLRRKY